MYFGSKTYLHICCGHGPSATTKIPTLMFHPMVPFRTYIKRTCNPMPSTGKHVNANNQLEEEFDYANFSYTKSKQEKKKQVQSWIASGLLFINYSTRTCWLSDDSVDVISRNSFELRRLRLVSLLTLSSTAEPNEGLVSLHFTIHSS